jgi:hypothetical protein
MPLVKFYRIRSMQMFMKRDGTVVEYKLVTDPAEAEIWTTHRLKKSEIKIMTKCDRTTAAELRQEILDDILSREPNPSKKSAPPADEIPKRRQAAKPQHVKARQAKRKARR